MNKFLIKGIVICGVCGNQVISNSGKTFSCVELKRLACWGVDNKTCDRLWDWDYAYSQRKENETVLLLDKTKSIGYEDGHKV